MPDISFVNPKINKIENQEISIQVGLNGFSYIIRDQESKLCLLFKHYEFQHISLIDELIRKVEEIVAKESEFTNTYSNSNLIFISQKATLVPQEFFNTDYLKKYFEFSHTLNELDELHYNYISSIQAYNVFSIPNYLSGIFYPVFPKLNIYHQTTQLINYGMNEQGTNNNNKAVICLNHTFFDIQIFDNNRLLLSNSFQYTNSMDFIYFFLYACKQLRIKPSELDIYFLGIIRDKKEIKQELKQHVKQIHVPELAAPEICRNLNNDELIQFYNFFLS